MNREIITLTDEGTIIVPDNPNRVRMTVIEIANLLGIYHPTAKRYIRTIEQSGVAEDDYKMTCIVDTHGVHPEYYGLEMIAAVAFRVKSWQVDIFRRWLMDRTMRPKHKLHSRPAISLFIPMREEMLPN